MGTLVGGDWYDASPLLDRDHPEDTVVAVSVGDIIGHELAAAIHMGQVRSMLRQAAWDRVAGPPSSIMHAFETANTGVGLDAAGTALLAHLRRHDGQWTLTWVNAGHPDPILVRPDGTTELLNGHGRLFGLPRGQVEHRNDREVALPGGCTLVFYTDGVVERVGVDLDERTERLRGLVAAHAGADPDEVVDAIVAGFGRGAGDDVVAMAVHVG